jgi:iron complex transport system permease protein
MLLVYLVGMTGRAAVTPVRVLLAGVAIGAVMDGVGFAVRLRNPRAFDNMRFWDGALDGRGLEVAAAIAPFIAIGVVLCIVVGRSAAMAVENGSTPSSHRPCCWRPT